MFARKISSYIRYRLNQIMNIITEEKKNQIMTPEGLKHPPRKFICHVRTYAITKPEKSKINAK